MSHRQTWRAGVSDLSSTDGAALLVVMSSMILILAIASMLVLSGIVETRIAAASGDAMLTRTAAEAAVMRALVDLRSADWDDVLAGAVSSFSDGALAGARRVPDGTQISLEHETADMQCGRPVCSDTEIGSTAEERPWGRTNPRWRVFACGPLGLLLPGDPAPPDIQLVVWVADDPVDDADPSADGESAPGLGVIMLAARAYGPRGARRTVELLIERADTDVRILARHERHP